MVDISTAHSQVIELSDGTTHYQLVGQADRPTVVLIHGIAVPFTVWDANVDDLVASRIPRAEVRSL